MLALGILHETLIRWIDDPLRVLAQTQIFTSIRTDPEAGSAAAVETPDSVHVLTEFPSGARGLYHLSRVLHFGPQSAIFLFGSNGTLQYRLAPQDCLWGAQKGDSELKEILVPPKKIESWRVEEEFIGAIRGQETVRLTDFATGLRYMQFTEAVARSAQSGTTVEIRKT